MLDALIVFSSFPSVDPLISVFVDEFWILSKVSETQTTMRSFLGPFPSPFQAEPGNEPPVLS